MSDPATLANPATPANPATLTDPALLANNPLEEPTITALSPPKDAGTGADADTGAGTGNGATKAARERNSLSLDQRRALRRWANSQTIRPSHKACIEWFRNQYNQNISQSTVSHSLSLKYARLDDDPVLSGSRMRLGNWPDVEKLVLMWYNSMLLIGRQPSNEELGEKAKAVFQQMPRYKDEPSPEFSPGWIHRFKKRYGLLVRRQRRHASGPPAADDIPYLVDTIPRFMNINPDTSPAAIRESVNRIVGLEPSLATCARARDEIVHRFESSLVNQPDGGDGQQPHNVFGPLPNGGANANPDDNNGGGGGGGGGGGDGYEEDPDVLLQNALQALQQEEAEAEAQAAADREARERLEAGLPPAPLPGMDPSYAQHAAAGALATPTRNNGSAAAAGGSGSSGGQRHPHATARFSAGARDHLDHLPLTLTPIPAAGPVSTTDRHMRCPFCINQRMLRTIKEAVEHMATHVVV